jgi:hypothetical protein
MRRAEGGENRDEKITEAMKTKENRTKVIFRRELLVTTL